MKKILILSLALQAQVTFAQDTTAAGNSMLPLYLVSAMVLAVLLLVLVVAFFLIRALNLLIIENEKERAAKAGVAYVKPATWWDELTQKLNASVPVAKEQDIDMGHSFDGIRELDNHLPPWWKWLFYATIAWSVVYLVAYHITDSMPLSEAEYNEEVALAEEQAARIRASQPAAVIDENTLVFTPDAAIIEKGKTVFMDNNCGACHKNDGGGNSIGPNLTDDYWIHGGGIKNIFLTIKNGAVEKGMPAWGKAMSPQSVRDVTFFVMSLHGTNPAGAKSPQGELYKAEETKTPADSVNVQASL
ncbi:MAG TPA: cbb3-type cytochrome c oxidase N-terminal domain-containing protein [Ohtaekwangia sp.]